MKTMQENLQRFLSHLPDPVLHVDFTSEVVRYGNLAAERLFGFADGEMAGIGIAQLLTDIEVFAAPHPNGTDRNSVFFRRRDGTFFFTACRISPLDDMAEGFGDALLLIEPDDFPLKQRKGDLSSCPFLSSLAPLGSVHLDSGGTVLEVNAAFETFMGTRADALIGRSVVELIDSGSIAQFSRWLGEIKQQTASSIVEIGFRRPEAQVAWGHTAASYTPRPRGGGVFNLLIQDITACRSAFESANKHEVRLQAVSEARDEVILVLDEKGVCQNVWAQNETLLPRPKEVLPKKRVEEFFPEDVATPLAQATSRVLRTGRPETLEFRLDLPIGRRWFRGRLSALRHRVNRVCLLARDVTLHRQREEELQASENLLQKVLENIPVAAVMINEEGILTYCNNHFLQVAEVLREQALGRNWFHEFLPKEDRAWIQEAWSSFFSRGESPAQLEGALLTASGEIRRISWSHLLLTRGHDRGCLCLGVDLTEGNRASHPVEEMRPKSEIISTIAQEMQACLDPLLESTDLLLGHSKDKPNGMGEQKKALEEIRTRSQQLSSMVEDLAEVSRMELGESPSLHYSKTDIHQLSTSAPPLSNACPSDNPDGRDPDGEGLEDAFASGLKLSPERWTGTSITG